MKRVTICGKPFMAEPIGNRPINVGDLVRPKDALGVYRVLCMDGDEFIVRNVRYPDVIDHVPAEMMMGSYYICHPA